MAYLRIPQEISCLSYSNQMVISATMMMMTIQATNDNTTYREPHFTTDCYILPMFTIVLNKFQNYRTAIM